MFAENAPRLRQRGWMSLIPIHNPGKRPIPNVWQQYNATPPTDETIMRWCQTHPTAGIGLAVGHDQVIGVDLDFLDPAKADEARFIAENTLGDTPLIRVGRSPKAMLLYQHDGDLGPTRRLGGVELFTNAGQFVLYSTHPDTLMPYTWPVASPLDVSPRDLPSISRNALKGFIEVIAPLCQNPKAAAASANATSAGSGKAADLLRAFRDAPGKNPADIAAAAVSAAEPGDRHNIMVAAIHALMEIGLGDDAVRDALEDAYLGHFDVHEGGNRADTFHNAMKWNRQKIGAALDEIPGDILSLADAIARECGWD